MLAGEDVHHICEPKVWKKAFRVVNLRLTTRPAETQVFVPPEQSEGGSTEFSLWLFFCKWGDVTCPHFPPIPVNLEGWTLAGIIIILVAQNLPTRFLISCLEAEIFKFSYIMNLAKTPPPVTSFADHTSRARGLKFGRNNYHICGSKFANQIFDILSKSWDI